MVEAVEVQKVLVAFHQAEIVLAVQEVQVAVVGTFAVDMVVLRVVVRLLVVGQAVEDNSMVSDAVVEFHQVEEVFVDLDT